MSEQMRLDALLVSRGLVGGRDRAKELIAGGLVRVNGQPAKKAAEKYPADAALEVAEGAARFVSRAAHKLEGGLDRFSIDLTGAVVLDAGASTGGFTQCALERGAAKVYAVDVGRDQLAFALRADPRVINLEKTDIRALSPGALEPRPGFACCDVSFISLGLVLPALRRLLQENGQAVALVKPQFEAGKGRTGRGVIRDPRIHLQVLERVLGYARESGFVPGGLIPSPIRGGEGNAEYLLWLRRQGSEALPDLAAVVREALGGR